MTFDMSHFDGDINKSFPKVPHSRYLIKHSPTLGA
jgi:hypothetical protein